MKLFGIFRFELAYQARRPWPWLILGVALVITKVRGVVASSANNNRVRMLRMAS